LSLAIVRLSREIGLLAGKKRFYEETFTESSAHVYSEISLRNI
jgi:hypothetical protein